MVLKDLLAVTKASSVTAIQWLQNLPSSFSAKGPDLQGMFAALQSFLAKATEQELGKWSGSKLEKNFVELKNMNPFFEQVRDDALPKLWTVTVQKCDEAFLVNQAFMKTHSRVSFLPEPGVEGAREEFWKLCAAHLSPITELQALQAMGPLLQKTQELEKIKVHADLDTLMSKVAVFIHRTYSFTDALPLQSLLPELEAYGKLLQEITEAHKKIEQSVEKTREAAKVFLIAHVFVVFFKFAEPVMAHIASAESAIPSSYEKLVEQRNIGQLKACFFSKRTHDLVSTNIEAAVNCSESLKAVVKTSGHLLNGAILGKQKSMETSLKCVRQYLMTVHAANLLLNKVAGCTPRERSAKVRELLELELNCWFC